MNVQNQTFLKVCWLVFAFRILFGGIHLIKMCHAITPYRWIFSHKADFVKPHKAECKRMLSEVFFCLKLFLKPVRLFSNLFAYSAKTIRNSIKNPDDSFQFLFSIFEVKKLQTFGSLKCNKKKLILISNRTIKWHNACSFVLMIDWTTASFM